MRELNIAIGLSFAFVILIYILLAGIIPADAGTIAGGSFALTPIIYELLQNKRYKSLFGLTNVGLDKLTQSGFYITVIAATAMIFGWGNVINYVTAVIMRTALQAKTIDEASIAIAIIAACYIPNIMVYFMAGRWVAKSRANKILCILTIAILVILVNGLSEFFIIPKDWFHRAYPWSQRTPSEFIKFMFYPIPIIVLPLSAGTYYYSRKIVFLRAASLLSVLPAQTQIVILDLIRDEISTKSKSN